MKIIPSRVGFISTRLAGTDGVSLETEKWTKILEGMGHECFYFAGESDRPESHSIVAPEAHFNHPDITAINHDLFDDQTRSSKTTGLVHSIRFHLKQHLYQFITTFDINLLIIENALSIPMNIPLGLAITELIAETNIPTIAHHHDFSWERSRFAVTSGEDYLRAAFPPTLPSIHHVVINSFGARQLALRTGARSMLIPNVMDFEQKPAGLDDYGLRLRDALGIGSDEALILQPTRIVPRKRIELAIELTHRLGERATLVITHQSGDEGSAYEKRLHEDAELLGASVIFGAEIVNHRRHELDNGRQVFSLKDAYQQSDLVTYPSTIEGFGNAFLETIYYCRPIVISAYEIFKTDILPKGFRVIEFDDFIEQETVDAARAILQDPSIGEEMADHNFKLGQRYYSFKILESNLSFILNQMLGA
jgi:glycosyltransferase involved in cell wall biosynthesis